MDFDALLTPIAGSSPCGEDLSFSIEFDRIAEMRREDDPTLDQGEWLTNLKTADWAGVAELSAHLLTTRSKDLRLMMWLTEAQALTQGYEGLAQGLKLCACLCEQHWLALHPLADAGDMDERIGNIAWLLQRIVALAHTLPVTRGRHGAAHSLRDMAAARQWSNQTQVSTDSDSDEHADRLALDQFNRELHATPKALLRARLDALTECIAHLQAWQTVIDLHLGHNGPSFVNARDVLNSCRHDMERLARECGALGDQADDAVSAINTSDEFEPTSEFESDTRRVDSSRPKVLSTRKQALQQLRDVADFFRRTEPHSPVAYLADKAVSWGDMPLHEWLRQVVKDQGSMSHLEELLGLQHPNTEGA
jgi:type VI secretion system protein ImpA